MYRLSELGEEQLLTDSVCKGGVRDAERKERRIFFDGNDYYHWHYRMDFPCG